MQRANNATPALREDFSRSGWGEYCVGRDSRLETVAKIENAVTAADSKRKAARNERRLYARGRCLGVRSKPRWLLTKLGAVLERDAEASMEGGRGEGAGCEHEWRDVHIVLLSASSVDV